MIVLYTMQSVSPNIHKVIIMLQETGLPYTIQHVALHDASFLAINPAGTVPTIVDQETGTTLFESAAILFYLAEKSKQFLPATLAERAEVVQWLIFEVADFAPVLSEIYHYTLYVADELSELPLQRYKEKLARYCTILDRQIGAQDFICGRYSIADMALYPWTVTLEELGEIDLTMYPNITRWAGNNSQRPATQLMDHSR